MRGNLPAFLAMDELTKPEERSHKRDKSKNTPAFNKMASARRAKAKESAKARKKNRGK